MALTLCCNRTRAFTILSSRRIRLPLVGAFCVLSLGLSNFIPSSSSSLKSGHFAPLLGSRVGKEEKVRSVHSIRMSASLNTVPSIVVYVTVPNKEAGKRLAESIVKEKLAACVNRVPVYEWEGKVQTDSEELLIIKTRESLLGALTEHVKANHEYE